MRTDLLIEQLDLLAEAPNGAECLRKMILWLAVRGKLVSQRSSEEPASALLERIWKSRTQKGTGAERAQLLSLAPPCDSSGLPAGWRWTRLQELGEFCGGATPSTDRSEFWGGNIPWVSPKDMKATHIVSSELCITETALQTTRIRLIPKNSILIVARSGILKRILPVAINDVPCTVNQDLKVLIPCCQDISEYVRLMLRGHEDLILEKLVKGGMTVQSLRYEEFEEFPFPLPPLAEQHRIVAKVDELMALCDELEARQKAKRETRERLVASALDKLTSARDAAEFDDHWHRLRDHFDFLFDHPSTIPPLRQAVLRLAVQGRLDRQISDDEPILRSISASRLKAGLGFFHGAESSPRGDDHFEIPPTWCWVTVGDVALHRLGKMLDQAKNRGTPRAYLRNTNVHWFRFDLNDLKCMPFEEEEVEEFELVSGDIVICEGGHGIGRTAVWRGQLPGMMFQKALHRVRPLSCLNPDFFSYCVRVYENIGILQKYYTGAGIPHLTGKSLSQVRFPLPPVYEQDRIVAKVTELLSTCDNLEVGLLQAQASSESLLSASVAHLLNGDARSS